MVRLGKAMSLVARLFLLAGCVCAASAAAAPSPTPAKKVIVSLPAPERRLRSEGPRCAPSLARH
jgi:hypothetical protein